MASNDPLVRFTGVQKTYDGHTLVVRDLNLNIQSGEFLSLLGPSGSGKTTTLMMLAGFESPTSGEIFLAGKPITKTPPHKRNFGMVFQNYALFPHMTIADNVAYPLSVRKVAKPEREARVKKALDMVHLGGKGDRFPGQLSGGQQQRVALARALAPDPELLLLDEPFSSLDVELRSRLATELRDILKARGITAILVTHDQQEAFAIADEIGVMEGGRLLQWDNAYNLYHRPVSRFVADFVGQGVFLPGRLRNDSEVELELGVLRSEFPFANGDRCPRCTTGSQVDVLLRPDDLVHDDAAPLRAEVLAKSFRGADFLYTLRLASGRRVLSLVPSHHNHAIGEHIGIRLDADHVVAFRHPDVVPCAT
jgi:iron(III) transport system ATP-binding protein